MVIHTKVNGKAIASMEKEPISKSYLLTVKKKKINILEILLMAFIMEKESWNTEMETNIKANGLLAKKKEKVCIIGLMAIIMMVSGKKIRPRDKEQLVLVESFLMGNSIWGKSMGLENKLMKTVIL
jgi:hypothetical protein